MQHEECSSRFYDTKIAIFPLNLTSVNGSIARAHSVSSLTFVEARAVVDLGLQRLVRVSGGRAHLPGCLEHDVVPAHRGALLTILSGCLKVNETAHTVSFIYLHIRAGNEHYAIQLAPYDRYVGHLFKHSVLMHFKM